MRTLWALPLLLAAAPLRAGERAITLVVLPTSLNTAQAGPKLSVVPDLAKLNVVVPGAGLGTDRLKSLTLAPSSKLLAAQTAALSEGAASQEQPTAFGGLKAIEASQSEQTTKKGGAEASVSIGKRFDGAGRSLSGGVYAAGGEAAPFQAKLSEGVLAVSGADASSVDARQELAVALKVFGRGVRAITGGHAVRTLAEEAGFTTAFAGEDGTLSLFVRPGDVVLDKAGKPWRRSAVKREKTATWERFTDGNRSVWVLRRSDFGELLVAEYPGDSIPKSGTPARALAVFSPGGGSYVDAAKSELLDVDAERSAYYSGK